MSTKQAHKTKETLQAHEQEFKNLQSQVDDYREDYRKRLYRQISIIDEEEGKLRKKQNQRKKLLVLKTQVSPYTEEREKDMEQVPVDGEIRAGSMVFMKNCATCHTLEAIDIRPMKGPSLGLIYNRRAGSNTNFEQLYTNEMVKANFYWTSRNLYNFMANPTSLVPNTLCKLKIKPLTSEQDRADLITLFRQFTTEMIFNMRLHEIKTKGYDHYQTSLYVARQQQTRGNMRSKSDASRQRQI